MTDAVSHTVLGDWGTSRLRLWLAAGTRIVGESQGPGIGVLTGGSAAASPAAALQAALEPWRQRMPALASVVLCGMAGSRNGLLEVPYLPTPADAGDWATGQRHARCGQFGIAISPGLRCVNAAGAPDVMRGEETQIFGALALEPSLRRGLRVMVLPGTHSKWVQLRDGAVAGFRTYITGELFALLKHHSTLLRAGTDTGATDGAFAAGLTRSESCGSGLAAAVFEARTGQLLAGRTYAWAGEFLSGLLIGAEVHSALAHHADGPGDHPIMLVGDPGLTALYGQALAHYRNATVQADGAACAIAGLMRLAGLSQGNMS